MISRLREPFGKAGLIVAVVALVAAVGGGAYAAGGGLSGKQKQEVKKIAKVEAKKIAGGPGAQGPAGPQGSSGKDGLNGLDGAPGSAGKSGGNGKSVAIGEGAPGCTEGGITVEVESSGAPQEVCNGDEGVKGKEGSPWTAGGTLPANSTETGSWSVGTYFGAAMTPVEAVAKPLLAQISFVIPLADALDSSHVHFVGVGETAPSGCTGGTAVSPKADSGNLCVFLGETEKVAVEKSIYPAGSLNGAEGASTAGAILAMLVLEEGAGAWGTWAVTG
jgi:hypothetical protein